MAQICNICGRVLGPEDLFGSHAACMTQLADETHKRITAEASERRLVAIEKAIKDLTKELRSHNHPAPAIGFPILDGPSILE